MKGEEARQRKKEGRTRNGERSRHKAKGKGKHRESRLGSQEAEDVSLPAQQKLLAGEKVSMAKSREESAGAICLQVLLRAGLCVCLREASAVRSHHSWRLPPSDRHCSQYSTRPCIPPQPACPSAEKYGHILG